MRVPAARAEASASSKHQEQRLGGDRCAWRGTGSSGVPTRRGGWLLLAYSPGRGAHSLLEEEPGCLGIHFPGLGLCPSGPSPPQHPREAAKGKRVVIALLVSLPTKPPVPRRRLQEEVPPAADTCALTAQPASGASAPRTRCSLEPPAHPPRCPGPPRISPSNTHTATCTRERPLTQTCTGCVQKPCPGPTPAVAERGLSTE